MNSRDRFTALFQRRVLDRPPVDYMGHYKTDARLKAHLGLETEEELLDRLGIDFYYLPARDISQNEGYLKIWKGPKLEMTETERTCPLGIRWTRGVYDHKYCADEVLRNPLAEAQTEKDILAHRWPRPADFDFSPLHEECERHADRAIVGGLWTSIMGDAYRLIGFQNFLLNLGMQSPLVKTLVNKVTDVYLELNDALFTEIKGKIDVWYFASDFGSQTGMLMHPATWHDIFFENIQRLVALARSHGIKTMFHSCGGIVDIIPGMIDAGIDILDPIQVSARGMEPEFLAREFGDRIIFHGGVDTQQVLPNATPAQVAAHARDTAAKLGVKGGYIFAPSQALAPDIPLENIVAMYDIFDRR